MDLCVFVVFFGTGPIPLDPDRNSVQNALSFAPVALMATPFEDFR